MFTRDPKELQFWDELIQAEIKIVFDYGVKARVF